MQNSVALINPSLFEGWSSSVEEAKSLGKRIILSDIPVHKEQDPPGGRFFFPDRAESLADLMQEILEERNLDEDSKLLSEAHEALRKRKMAFAERYQNIVLYLLDHSATN
jgi:glycosyltransferase involved in cell wall biosynthesis